MFIPTQQLALRMAKLPDGKPAVWGHDFADAKISHGKGKPRVAARLWGRRIGIQPRGFSKEAAATETEAGFSFALEDALGTLRFEHRDRIELPDKAIWIPEFGLLKTTLTLDAAPPRGEWTFDLDAPPSVKFAYQPPLTPAEIDAGCIRPDWCVGSYAIFDGPAKLGHLTRPFAIDADGNWTWGTLSVAGGAATVRIDKTWLAAARYPVAIDPNIGYTSVGGTSIATTANYVYVWTLGGGSGVATAMYLYCNSSSARNITMGLYGANGTWIATTPGAAGPTSANWHTQSFASPPTLTNGLLNLGAQNHDGGALTQYYDSDANSLQTYGLAASTYSGGSLPSPLPALAYATASWSPIRWSFYCEFTAPVYPAEADVKRNSATYGADGLTVPLLIQAGAAHGSLDLSRETGANARGGSGTCAKLSPTSTTVTGYLIFYVPSTAAAATLTLSFYWAKSAAGFNGSLKVSIYDVNDGAALLSSEVVDITAADTDYHLYTATHVHPGDTGLCRVELEVLDGASSGDLYIDDIAVV